MSHHITTRVQWSDAGLYTATVAFDTWDELNAWINQQEEDA